MSCSVDGSQGGRYMATSGRDGKVKVWDCRNWKGAVREWAAQGGTAIVEWSQRGYLAVATGGSVNVSFFNESIVTYNVLTLPAVCVSYNPCSAPRNGTTATVPYSSNTTSPAYLSSICTIPRYPHRRSSSWFVQHLNTRIW